MVLPIVADVSKHYIKFSHVFQIDIEILLHLDRRNTGIEWLMHRSSPAPAFTKANATSRAGASRVQWHVLWCSAP